jgi:hypothetical protein
MTMRKSIPSGVYTFDFEKVGDIVSVVVKSPGDAVVANGAGHSTNDAARNAAATANDEGLTLTVNSTHFPDF